MRVDVREFENVESGPVVILGNAPCILNWELAKLKYPTIGVNRSPRLVQSPYLVTTAEAVAEHIEAGEFTADKAVFTNRDINEDCPQPVVRVDMSLPDIYGPYGYSDCLSLFDYDLTKPIYKTFSGMLAVQVALFLGYDTIYLLGFDGTQNKFYPYTGAIEKLPPPGYQAICFLHVHHWLEHQDKVKIYRTNPGSTLSRFPLVLPPLHKE